MNSQHECKHQQLAAKNTLLLKATSYMLQMKTIHLLGVVEQEKKKSEAIFLLSWSTVDKWAEGPLRVFVLNGRGA